MCNCWQCDPPRLCASRHAHMTVAVSCVVAALLTWQLVAAQNESTTIQRAYDPEWLNANATVESDRLRAQVLMFTRTEDAFFRRTFGTVPRSGAFWYGPLPAVREVAVV